MNAGTISISQANYGYNGEEGADWFSYWPIVSVYWIVCRPWPSKWTLAMWIVEYISECKSPPEDSALGGKKGRIIMEGNVNEWVSLLLEFVCCSNCNGIV
jgi:hypothetical protein